MLHRINCFYRSRTAPELKEERTIAPGVRPSLNEPAAKATGKCEFTRPILFVAPAARGARGRRDRAVRELLHRSFEESSSTNCPRRRMVPDIRRKPLHP